MQAKSSAGVKIDKKEELKSFLFLVIKKSIFLLIALANTTLFSKFFNFNSNAKIKTSLLISAISKIFNKFETVFPLH